MLSVVKKNAVAVAVVVVLTIRGYPCFSVAKKPLSLPLPLFYVAHADSHEIFAIADDVTKRGLASLLDSRIKVIEYGDLVDLIVADKVYNFA